MTMQDGIIQNYATERQKINELIETKKAELILKANEEAYAEAIQKKTEAATTYANAQETFNDVMKRAEEYAVKVNEANLEYARILQEDGIEAAQDYMYTQQEVFDTYSQLQQEVTNTRAALKDATEAYQGYNQTIQNYEGLSAAIIGGDSQEDPGCADQDRSRFQDCQQYHSRCAETAAGSVPVKLRITEEGRGKR